MTADNNSSGEGPSAQAGGLYYKLAAIAGRLGDGVAKDGHNKQLNYRYASPSSVMQAVKPLLAEHRVAIVPTVESVEKAETGTETSNGAPIILTRVNMAFLLTDGDTGEQLIARWTGEGQDWSDKGIAKAQTIALRTFLINLFQIPQVDEEHDPDFHEPERRPRYSGGGGNSNGNGNAESSAPSGNGNGPSASEKQIAAIYTIARAAKRLSETQTDDLCVETFGVRPQELTKSEASQFIDQLKG